MVNNAIKYRSPERKPEIGITTHKIDGFIVIRITDNGMGIEKTDFDKIFAKYQRISDTIEGSGIGLFLVKEIVAQSGGKIEVESELGKGSTFTIYLKINL